MYTFPCTRAQGGSTFLEQFILSVNRRLVRIHILICTVNLYTRIYMLILFFIVWSGQSQNLLLQATFSPLEINKVSFYTMHFYYINRQPLIRAFQWYLGWCLHPKIDPKPANLHLFSSFLCPSQKFTAPSANPAQRWNHTINLFMVWNLCLYGFSAGCG